MSDEVAIGIDLGTSNSCVAVSDGRQVEVLRNSYGESVTASVVAFRENGSIVVGNAAKANLIHDPRHTVASAKRLIGRYAFSDEVKKAQELSTYRIVEGENHAVRIEVREEQFAVPEISAMVLREMKSIAEARLGHEVTKAVVTVPAYFNDNQRQATKDAARIAGLEVLRLLNEPTAAALAFGFGRGLNQRVAVYDLGGGTFDISILEIGTDVFEVLATFGDTYLGGDDFDERIIDMLADEFAAKENIDLRSDPYALEKLKLAAETAKKGLSEDDSVEVNIPEITMGPDGKPRSIQRTLNQHEFTSLVMDLIQRSFKVCDEALQHAGVIARDLDGVIMVGGPTRLPVIRKAVGEYFQQEPQAGVDPDQIVAMGAAIHASSLVSSAPQEAYLLDVTPLSLRVGVAGGLAETVIDRNTPVPIEQSRNFTTVQDYQESVKIMVYQGESRQASENELLGQFEFSGFEKKIRGAVPIEVTFEINGDGIVNVRARDPESGREASTQITLSSGLSESDVQEIIERGRTDRVATEGATAEPGLAPAEATPGAEAPEDEDLFPAPVGGAVAFEPGPEPKAGAAIEIDASAHVAEIEVDHGPAHAIEIDPAAADDELEIEVEPAGAQALEVEPAGAHEIEIDRAPNGPHAPAAAGPATHAGELEVEAELELSDEDIAVELEELGGPTAPASTIDIGGELVGSDGQDDDPNATTLPEGAAAPELVSARDLETPDPNADPRALFEHGPVDLGGDEDENA